MSWMSTRALLHLRWRMWRLLMYIIGSHSCPRSAIRDPEQISNCQHHDTNADLIPVFKKILIQSTSCHYTTSRFRTYAKHRQLSKSQGASIMAFCAGCRASPDALPTSLSAAKAMATMRRDLCNSSGLSSNDAVNARANKARALLGCP